MAEIYQINSVVNEIAKQAYGAKAISAINGDFVKIGEKVLSNENNMDAFYKALNDVLTKQSVTNLPYVADKNNLFRDPIEYGSIIQQIYIDYPDARENTSWWGQKNKTQADPFEIFDTDVKVQFFKGFSAWEFDATVPDVQLKTAFLNPANMLAFIDGIGIARNNSLQLSYENTANISRGCWIVRAHEASNKKMVVNLRSIYNAQFNKTLTPFECLYDASFLKFASKVINMHVTRFKKISTLFNAESYKRHCPKEELEITILDDFATSQSMYLESDTYHKEMVALPNYTETSYWQGEGESYDFAETSTVNVEIDDEETEINNIIGVMHSKRAIGVTVRNERTRSIYNPRRETNNYFSKAEIGYYNNMTENGIVFTLN